MDNPTFEDPISESWFELQGDSGDNSDVNATTSPGQVNFEVLGDSKVYNNISGVPKPEDGWALFKNSYFIEPDYYENSSITGLMANHTFWEGTPDGDQSRNRPSIHYRRNVSMLYNMSDYIITSVTLSAIVSGTADTNVETRNDDLSTGGTDEWSYTYNDTARFYVKFSNLNYEDLYEVAFYQTVDLGTGDQLHDGSGTLAPNLYDTNMSVIDESILIFYLTRALEYDNKNFGITLGIDIYTEDNYNDYDLDTFHSLRIKSFNLSFTYEKKMDKLTSASWNQNANKISELSGDEIIVDEAILSFKYTRNDTWPSNLQNSEIRVLINDNLHFETVKLRDVETSFQEEANFDVTSLITDDVNLSIQLFLADDDFSLNRTITFSIDDVTLTITYTVIFPDKESDIQLFLNNEEKTSDPNIELTVGEKLNITVKYLNSIGDHIPNANIVLLGNYTGNFTENALLKQHSILITTDTDDIGVNFLTIEAKAEDYITQKIISTVTVTKIDVEDLQLFLNGENRTLDPYIQLIYGEELNITTEYTDLSGIHIPNAMVKLISERLTKNLVENFTLGHYSIKINTSERLKIGNNYLSIEAQEENLQTKIIDLRVSIRKINLEIIPVSGSNTIEITPGENITISVNLINTDFGGMIQGAIITYIWDIGNGILTDSDNDGIYEAFIENVPSGTHSIEISAFVGDEYFTNDYELVLTSFKLGEDPTLFQTLVIITSIIVAVLAIYLVMYQRYLKYPKSVRKVRKYKRTLKRKTAPSIRITDRKNAFSSLYKDEIKPVSGSFKGKSSLMTTESKSKQAELNLESEELISNSLEKKAELDKIIEDSSKSNSKPNNI